MTVILRTIPPSKHAVIILNGNCFTKLNRSSTAQGFLPPANEAWEGYVFMPVFQSFCSQGEVGLYPGGSAPRGGLHPWGLVGQTPPSDTTGYGQRAGGTHPT